VESHETQTCHRSDLEPDCQSPPASQTQPGSGDWTVSWWTPEDSPSSSPFLILPLLHDNGILVIVADDGAFHDHRSPYEIMLLLKLLALELFQQTVTLN